MQLLSGKKKTPPFWSFEYYQQFFDVDTSQVGRRLLGSFVPQFGKTYLDTHIRPSPDLYGEEIRLFTWFVIYTLGGRNMV